MNRSGWGAALQWSEVVNAVGYQVDRSEAGGPFALFAGIDATAQPAVGGLFAGEDATVLPGISYAYRVMARFATGPASGYSPTATYVAPTQLAQVSNLTATLSAPFSVTATAPPQRTVTWSWQGVPGALTYEAEIEQLSGATSLGKTRLSLPVNAAPPYSAAVETGRSVSFCISLVRPASVIHALRYGVCLVTNVSGTLQAMVPGPGGAAGPVTTATSTAQTAARCTPGAASAPPPLKFMAFGMRVGGAPLQWISESSTEYLIERAPAGAAGGTTTWTRLTTSCDAQGFLVSGSWLDEDLMTYPTFSLADAFPGVQLGGAYQYRLTRIQADGTSGSATVYWDAPSASFQSTPTASLSGNVVTLTTGVSYCQPLGIRCDPWMLDFAVTASSSGFSYTSRQPWIDTYDPAVPASEPGTMAFKVSGVPSGTHTFTVTALYQPDHRVAVGSVTVQVP